MYQFKIISCSQQQQIMIRTGRERNNRLEQTHETFLNMDFKYIFFSKSGIYA